ncbi:MAG TPA: efflux RND transporter periplasmic adaptor subunit [Methylosinus sp.]
MSRRSLLAGRRVRIVAIILLLTGAAFAAWRVLAPAPAAKVATARVTRRDVENTVLATGALQAIRQVDVGTRVTGQLKSLKVKNGDHVAGGQLVAEIDPLLPENELRAAQAHLANLEAQRRAAFARMTRARLELERQRGMIRSKATARKEVEAAEAEALAGEASLSALDAQIAQAKSQIGIAEANLSYTRITAPIDGEVVGVTTQEGQTVVAAQIVPVILKLARLDQMTIRTQISEADVIHVKVGQPVSFTIMGDPDKKYSGVLRAVELAPQNYSDPAQSQNSQQSSSAASGGANQAVFYNALFDVPNPDGALRIGMTAQVSITLGVIRDALTLPSSALREQGADGRYALRVVDAKGRSEPRQVRIGVDNHIVAEVLEGLSEGEEVALAESAAPGPRP